MRNREADSPSTACSPLPPLLLLSGSTWTESATQRARRVSGTEQQERVKGRDMDDFVSSHDDRRALTAQTQGFEDGAVYDADQTEVR